MAPSPSRMIRIATTQAKIGRSMKTRDIWLGSAAGGAGRPGPLRRTGRNRLDLRSFAKIANTLGDDLLAGGEALGHHPILPVGAFRDHRPLDRRVAGPDHP